MKHIRNIVCAGTAMVIGMAGPVGQALAAPGVVTQGINLRAGPGTDYPWLASLPPGTPTDIHGCLSGWGWCDVSVEGIRGWAAGAGLAVVYDGAPEPLQGYGTEIGLPFVGFDTGDYWGRYYRGRPFYNQVDRWRDGGPGPGGPGWDRDGRGDEGRGGGGGPPDRGPGGPGGFQGYRGGPMQRPEPQASEGPMGPHAGPMQNRMPEQPGGPQGGGMRPPGGGGAREPGGAPDRGHPQGAGPAGHEPGNHGNRDDQRPH